MLFLVALLAALVQIIVMARLDDPRIFLKYWDLAGELIAGNISPYRLNDVSPLYLWCIAALRTFRFGTFSVQMLQLLANTLTILMATAISFRLVGRTAAGFTAAALILNRSMFVNATQLEPESLILLLNTSALFFLFGRRSRRRYDALLAGLFFGLSATARLVALPAALIIGIVVFVRMHTSREQTSSLRSFALAYVSGVSIPIVGTVILTAALTGHGSIMNPGTVFYEGWNPHATGYAMTAPLVVSDVRSDIEAPDPLHIAYRVVASRAGAESGSPRSTNRFWTGKSVEFLVTLPGTAAALGLTKLFFAFHSYDAWDLATMVTCSRQLGRVPWIPFGGLISLAMIAVIAKRQNPAVIALTLGSLSYVMILFAFYVTSRQRNALVSMIAILAGIGLQHLFTELSVARRRALLVAALVVLSTILLTLDYRWQSENRYGWTSASRSETLVMKANEAAREGRVSDEMRLRAIDRIWILGDDPHIPSAPRPLVGAVAKAELARADSPARLFDLALALQYAREWDLSDRILLALEEQDYRPIRQTLAVDSVAYYRTLAALHTGDEALAWTFLDTALDQAPGDPNVLAMQTVGRHDQNARAILFSLHDGFTARAALARAHFEMGDLQPALRLAKEVEDEIPEWNRVRLLREYLSDLSERHGTTPEPVS